MKRSQLISRRVSPPQERSSSVDEDASFLRRWAGPLFMLGSALSFSVMAVFVKLAGQRLPSAELVFFRALISVLLSWYGLRKAGESLFGSARPLLWIRGLFGSLGIACVFYSFTHLPMAEATVIQYLYPVFVGFLAWIFLGERVSWKTFLGVGVSFCGVALVVSPPEFRLGLEMATRLIEHSPVALAAALGGAFLSASAYVCVRRLSATEHPLRIIFYFPFMAIPISLALVGRDFLWPQGVEWLWIAAIGIFTQSGQVWLTRGFQLQPAAVASSFSYSQVVFAMVWGWIFFAEHPAIWTLLGAGFVFAGSMVVVWERGKSNEP